MYSFLTNFDFFVILFLSLAFVGAILSLVLNGSNYVDYADNKIVKDVYYHPYLSKSEVQKIHAHSWAFFLRLP